MINKKSDNVATLSPPTEDLLSRTIYRRSRPARSKKKSPSPEAIAKRREKARKKMALYSRKLHNQRIAANLCVKCGKQPPYEDRRACEMCLEKQLNIWHNRKAYA